MPQIQKSCKIGIIMCKYRLKIGIFLQVGYLFDKNRTFYTKKRTYYPVGSRYATVSLYDYML